MSSRTGWCPRRGGDRLSANWTFALNLENGDRIAIEHPENIAFDPRLNGSPGSNDFYVITNELRVFGTFDAVTSVALIERGE